MTFSQFSQFSQFFQFFQDKEIQSWILNLFKLKEIDLIKTFMEVLFMEGLFVHLLYRESIGLHADVHMEQCSKWYMW